MTWSWTDHSYGGPVLYDYPNRTPVTGDVPSIFVCLVFSTVFVAFLIIFPGIRKERLTTFTTVTLSLFVGNVIMLTKIGSGWHVATTEILSTYRAFSKELVQAQLGAYIGLAHVNITLKGLSGTEDIDYNERFTWLGSTDMGESYHEALHRGLPFPILTVAEHFSLGEEGFNWGGQYRAAGYYGSVLLWASLASWLLMNLMLVVVPRYGAYLMTLTGFLMLSAAVAYHCLLPSSPLLIRFEHNRQLSFKFGWCYYLVIIAGAICLLVGLIITTVDMIYPNVFSTILEVDYDTPYDRHVIIEESHHKTKYWNKGLEEPPGLGTRILRRLSSKKDDVDRSMRSRNGLDNRGFELDTPKTAAWRGSAVAVTHPPPLHRPVLQAAFRRTDSAGSNASSLRVDFLNPSDRHSDNPAVRFV